MHECERKAVAVLWSALAQKAQGDISIRRRSDSTKGHYLLKHLNAASSTPALLLYSGGRVSLFAVTYFVLTGSACKVFGQRGAAGAQLCTNIHSHQYILPQNGHIGSRRSVVLGSAGRSIVWPSAMIKSKRKR